MDIQRQFCIFKWLCLIFIAVSGKLLTNPTDDFLVCVTSRGEDLCLNGGRCGYQDEQVFCHCPANFFGFRCEKLKCFFNPCLNSGLCEKTSDSYVCHCDLGFGGRLCEKKLPSACDSKPCGNGTCTLNDSISNYKCNCSYGYTGENCSVIEDVDECAMHFDLCPGEVCVNTVGSFRCESNKASNALTVNSDFDEKQYFNNIVNDCQTNICKNGGVCLYYLFAPNIPLCFCQDGFAGHLCEIAKSNPCDSNDCHHGFICKPTSDYISYTCQCPQHLSGVKCEIKLVPCVDYNPCAYGICEQNTNADFKCVCAQGFSGNLCDVALLPNSFSCHDASPCQNEGKCVASNTNEFECICKEDFEGVLCENKKVVQRIEKYELNYFNRFWEIDCRMRSCENQGTCILNENISAHKCNCLPGFAGRFCEIDVNECLPNLCLNKARCINLINDFRCDCAPGYSGVHCELDINECKNVNCLNGGSCVDAINAFSCQCAGGFMGRYCEVDVRQFDKTDALERELCKQHNCAQKAHNGKCDKECNFYACEFDAGDCALDVGDPFGKCETRKSFCAHVFADGNCDEICNDESCLFDAFDCPTPKSNFLFPKSTCKENINILNGELSLILLVKKLEFFEKIQDFLREMSSHLRASLRIALDESGRSKIYAWQSDSGAQKTPISLPNGFDVNKLSVSFAEMTKQSNGANKTIPIRINRFGHKTTNVTKGVKVFLQIQVELCCNSENSFIADSSCFSTVESVAFYLGAANAKKSMQDVSFNIHTAKAFMNKTPSLPKSSNNLFPIALASAFIILICVMIVLQAASRKRKFINAPVFKPPTLAQNKCKGSMLSVNSFYNNNSEPKKRWYRPLLNSIIPNFGRAFSNDSNNTRYSLPVSTQNTFLPNDFACKSLENPLIYSPTISYGHHMYKNYTLERGQSAFSSNDVFEKKSQLILSGSSSGVSSGQLSPLDDSMGFEHQKYVMTLHTQAVSKEGILNPVDPTLVNVCDIRGQTPLMALFSASRYDERTEEQLKTSIERLIAAGADINAQDKEGQTALILAVKAGRSQVVEQLLFYKSDVNLTDLENQAPIHHAVEALVLDCLIRLLACADLQIDALTQRAETALILCAKMVFCAEAIQFAQLLIDAGANLDGPSAKDGGTTTALHVAASVDNVEMIRLLISKGANKEATDIERRTSLTIAAMNGHLRASQELIRFGASFKHSDVSEKSLLQHAIESNNMDVISLFKTIEENEKFSEKNWRTDTDSEILKLSQIVVPIDSTVKSQSKFVLFKGRSHAVVAPKLMKQARTAAGTITKKSKLKACKTKRLSQNYYAVEANNLMALTPPNSDQSTIYSTTPSPTNLCGGVKNFTTPFSTASTSSAYPFINAQQQNYDSSLQFNQKPICELTSSAINYHQNDYNRHSHFLINTTGDVWLDDFYSSQHLGSAPSNHLLSPASINGQTPPMSNLVNLVFDGNLDGSIANTSLACTADSAPLNFMTVGYTGTDYFQNYQQFSYGAVDNFSNESCQNPAIYLQQYCDDQFYQSNSVQQQPMNMKQTHSNYNSG